MVEEAHRLEQSSTELAHRLAEVSIELSEQIPALVQPRLAGIVFRQMIRAGRAQISTLAAVADGLQRINDLPVDVFLDLGVDPEEVAKNVTRFVGEACELITRVDLLLEASITEAEMVEAEPWEWRLRKPATGA